MFLFKNIYFCFCLLLIPFSPTLPIFEIKTLTLDNVPAAKRVIATVINEVWDLQVSVDEVLAELEENKLLNGENMLVERYFNNNGTYLTLVADANIVGTGAIKKLSDDICELKRMYILKEYRGQGWGKKIADQLLTFAREHGYKKVRLEVGRPEMQQQAVIFYKKLGFYEIEPYFEDYEPGELFMEMPLEQQ